MSRCWHCGGEIEFRYIDGRPTPIHLSGGWCQGDHGHSRVEVTPSEYRFEDVCRETTCPICRQGVYFFTHNGGSVWVDELGWPWPKHACFSREKTPPWMDFFAEALERKPQYRPAVGVICKARWMPAIRTLPPHILIAVDAGARGKVCVATNGSNTADYLLGRMASVDLAGRHMITSNHEERPIFDRMAPTWLLGLPESWPTIPYPSTFRPYPEDDTQEDSASRETKFHQETPETAARVAGWIKHIGGLVALTRKKRWRLGDEAYKKSIRQELAAIFSKVEKADPRAISKDLRKQVRLILSIG